MDSQSTALARRYGAYIAAASALTAALFVAGVARRSYVALAVPLAALVLGTSAAGIVLGRLLMTTPDLAEDPFEAHVRDS